jgi:hypothetical protein
MVDARERHMQNVLTHNSAWQLKETRELHDTLKSLNTTIETQIEVTKKQTRQMNYLTWTMFVLTLVSTVATVIALFK